MPNDKTFVRPQAEIPTGADRLRRATRATFDLVQRHDEDLDQLFAQLLETTKGCPGASDLIHRIEQALRERALATQVVCCYTPGDKTN
jgi:hypothetical protein